MDSGRQDKFLIENPGAIPAGLDKLLEELSGQIIHRKEQPITACAIYSILREYLAKQLAKQKSPDSGDRAQDSTGQCYNKHFDLSGSKGSPGDRLTTSAGRENEGQSMPGTGMIGSKDPGSTRGGAGQDDHMGRGGGTGQDGFIGRGGGAGQDNFNGRGGAGQDGQMGGGGGTGPYGQMGGGGGTGPYGQMGGGGGTGPYGQMGGGGGARQDGQIGGGGGARQDGQMGGGGGAGQDGQMGGGGGTGQYGGGGGAGQDGQMGGGGGTGPYGQMGGSSGAGQDGQMGGGGGTGQYGQIKSNRANDMDHLKDRMTALAEVLDETLKESSKYLSDSDGKSILRQVAGTGNPNQQPSTAGKLGFGLEPQPSVAGVPKYPQNSQAHDNAGILEGLHKTKIIVSETLILVKSNQNTPQVQERIQQNLALLVREVNILNDSISRAKNISNNLNQLQVIQGAQAGGRSGAPGPGYNQQGFNAQLPNTSRFPNQEATQMSPNNQTIQQPPTPTHALTQRFEALNEILDTILVSGQAYSNRRNPQSLPPTRSNFTVRNRGPNNVATAGAEREFAGQRGASPSIRMNQGDNNEDNRNRIPPQWRAELHDQMNPNLTNFFGQQFDTFKRIIFGEISVFDAPIHTILLAFFLVIGIVGFYGAVDSVWDFIY